MKNNSLNRKVLAALILVAQAVSQMSQLNEPTDSTDYNSFRFFFVNDVKFIRKFIHGSFSKSGAQSQVVHTK